MRGVGCVRNLFLKRARDMHCCRPREGRGLCPRRFMSDSMRLICVAVPVRGVGCVQLIYGLLERSHQVAVPVRGVGCVDNSIDDANDLLWEELPSP